MRVIQYREALREALVEEMDRNPDLMLMGEEIGVYAGAYKVTAGLLEQYGPERVVDTPMSEAAIVGAAVGAAVAGVPTVAEVMYIDFLLLTLDQLINQAAKMRYMFGGKCSVPMVVRTQGGTGRSSAAQHSQSLERLFFQIPGLRVAIPSTPADAKGLLKAAIRSADPVLFIEHKMLYNTKGAVPEGEHLVPLGRADIKRAGSDVTVVALSRQVLNALQAAEQLEAEGISVEVIDPRTLNPFDWESIAASVRKTGRLLTVEEGCLTGGVGAEICAGVTERCWSDLKTAPWRVAGKDVPIPSSPVLEKLSVPDAREIYAAVRNLVKEPALLRNTRL